MMITGTKGKAVSENGDPNLQALEFCISILLAGHSKAMDPPGIQ